MHRLEASLVLPLLALFSLHVATLSAQPHEHRQLPAPSTNPLDPDPQPFDVLHYAPSLDLRKAPSKEMSGRCDIRLIWTVAMEDPIFRFHLRDLEIDSIDYRDAGTTTPVRLAHETIGDPNSAEYHHEVVAGGHPAASGDTATFTIYYHGTMTDEFGPGGWGGVSSSENVLYAMGVGFTNNYVSTTQHWMPCYDHPSDKATFTGTFRAPESMRVASNGLVTGVVDEEDESRTWTWNHTFPAATYLLTFAVADYVEIDLGTPELPMLLFTKRLDSVATRASFERLPEMVSWFSEHFGPYPFEKVGFVNTPQGAMEHQTMVSFPTRLSRRGESLNLSGAHELAHQWFGDLVSPLDFRHAWLNESFATFSEALWLEKDGDFEGYLSGINGNLITYFGSVVSREGVLPLYDFPRASPSTNYPGTIYMKGAVVVGMLRYELGESRFFEAMRSYLDSFAYSTATTEDLQRICEEVSGKDLDFFFDQWVRRPGWPIYEIRRVDGERPGEISLTFEQIQSQEYGTFTGVSVDIGLFTQNGLVNRTVRIDSLEQTFSFDVEDEIELILFNQGPNLRTLAEFTLLLSGVEEDLRPDGSLPYQLVTNGTALELRSLLDAASASESRVEVYSTEGGKMVANRIDSFPHVLRTDGLPSGPYVLQLTDKRRSYSIPFILTR